MAETKAKKAEEKTRETDKNVSAGPAQEKTVLIKMPIDRSTEEDVVVWVNNKRYLIKRGVAVEVPESVALILRQQEEMLQICYEYEHTHAN